MYKLQLPRNLSHDGVLAAHGIVELLAAHEIDLEEAEEVLKWCYGENAEAITMDLQQMLVGLSSKPKIHKAIELGFQVGESNVSSGWNTYMVSKSHEFVQNFVQEREFQNNTSTTK